MQPSLMRAQEFVIPRSFPPDDLQLSGGRNSVALTVPLARYTNSRHSIDLAILKLANPITDYPSISWAAVRPLKAAVALIIIAVTYSRMFADE